ncbi:putative septum formation protein maf [Besnoitia besnoiti]|uniref:Putative septum formation protein maf n=1 Tax=Besnoitia besnoiti TaxID=94643 RepID=A0A2A9M8N9_BESBE|nr:putative septum formation protein maf [Besnoitia besnoiti]PFH32276.1 putative septum formation protein maf [Besnoitia besnoiti]
MGTPHARNRPRGGPAGPRGSASGVRTLLPLLPLLCRCSGAQACGDSPGEQSGARRASGPSASSAGSDASSSPAAARVPVAPPSPSATASASPPCVVLASASARRLELCRAVLNLPVECRPSAFESIRSFEKPPRREGAAREAEEGADCEGAEEEATRDPVEVRRREETDWRGTRALAAGDGGRTEGRRRVAALVEEDRRLIQLAQEDEARETGEQRPSSFSSPSWLPKLYALKTANGKARSVAEELWAGDEGCCCRARLESDASCASAACLPPRSIVIGADTIVDLDGEVLEKPRDAEDARKMLRSLSGRTHAVHTAVCLYTRQGGTLQPAAAFVESTNVTMRTLGEADIEAYLRTNEPLDKAGKELRPVAVN